MRIAFDASVLTSSKTGIGHYTDYLLRQLVQLPGLEVVPISHTEIDADFELPIPMTSPRALQWRNLWLQTRVPRLVKDLDVTVAHYTNQIVPLCKTTRQVLTIYDLSLHLFPYYHPFRRRLSRRLVSASIRQADRIVTISHSIADQLMRVLAVAHSKIHVVPGAASSHFRPVQNFAELEGIKRRYGLRQPTLLSVGTLEPRKNLARLLEAFSRVSHKSHTLTLVGAPGWGKPRIQEEIRRLGLHSRVCITGYVPDKDLPGLYNLADAFLYPSLYEGFGLPVIEAMACGTPVLTSQGGALEEHFSEAALFVDPTSVRSIQEGLERLLSSRALCQELSGLGLTRAARYSWKASAELTRQVYERTMKKDEG